MHLRDSGAALPELVRRHGVARPSEIFCTFLSNGTEQELTFGDLYRGGCAYARELQQRGVSRGDVIPVILQHTPHLFYSFLGAMLAGAVPTFMPFPSAKQRSDLFWFDHDTLFERLRPRLIVTYAENFAAAKAALPNFSIETLLASDALLEPDVDVEEPFPGLSASSMDTACLQHSSGTTGLKRGVILTHAAILDHFASYSAALAFTSADSIVSWLPLYHDMGFIACFMPSIIAGTHLIALDPFEWASRPTLLLDAIQRYRPSLCWLPNFAFSHITRTTRASMSYDLSSVRAFINCSEPCKEYTFQRFLERFAGSGVSPKSLQVCYAMAENVFAVTQTDLDRPANVLQVDRESFDYGNIMAAKSGKAALAIVSCGRLVDGVQARVRSPRGVLDEAGVVGEIEISSAYLFSGYYLQPEVTRNRLRDGWFSTGDTGFFHEGELYVTGRVDDMLIINGRNFYAHQIEEIVNAIPGVIPGRSVAIGVDEERADATVLIVLVEYRDESIEVDSLARVVRGGILETLGLTAHAVVVLPSGSLIKTTSGKISRVKNRELYLRDGFTTTTVKRKAASE